MTAANNIPAEAPVPGGARRKKIMLTIGFIFLLIGIGFALQWALFGRYVEETENAYVQGNVVQVTPQVSGTVTRIYVDDTMVVKPGQPLVSLDTADADVALAQAEAQLAQTVREVRTLYAGQGQSRANLTMREAELARTRDNLARRKALAGSGAISEEEIRLAENAVMVAQAGVAGAQEQLAAGRALTDGTTVAQHPNVQRAAARVREVMLAQARAMLFAPVGGEIAKRNVQVGQRISPGAPLMAIVPLDQLWVEANFKESQLRKMRIGQPVRLTADIYGGSVRFDGRIVGLGAGTGSAFALLPAQNATGNWIKVVQRVPVRIALDSQQLARHPLRIGLSMQVAVDLHEQRGQAVGENVSKGAVMSAFHEPSNAKAQARIDAIIAANLK